MVHTNLTDFTHGWGKQQDFCQTGSLYDEYGAFNYMIIADFSALYCALSYDHKCLLTIFYACYMFYCIFVVCYMYTAFSLYTMFNHAPLLIYTFATTRHGVYTEDFLREGPCAD